MKKQMISIHIVISIIICALLVLKHIIQAVLLAFPLLSMLLGIGQEASSVGIIGGIDGPTAVFLSSQIKYVFIIPSLEFIGIIYVLIILVRCYSKVEK